MNIFISYRRDDSSGYAGRLYDRLSAHFGRPNVFMDIEALEPGVDFVDGIDQAMDSCGALVVLIGTEWVTASDAQGRRRLDNGNDFIRLEVANALRRNLCVLPVLVNGAVMPTEEELPPELAPLARRQAQELSNTRWDYDVGRLIEALERWLAKAQDKTDDKPQGEDAAAPAAQPSPPRPDRTDGELQDQTPQGPGRRSPAWVWPAVAVLLLGVLAGAVVTWMTGTPTPPVETAPAVPTTTPAPMLPEPSPEPPSPEPTTSAQPEPVAPEPTPPEVLATPVATEPAPEPTRPAPTPPPAESAVPEPMPAVAEPPAAAFEPPAPEPEAPRVPVEPTPPEDPAIRIRELLEQADVDLQANRLTRPAGANAYMRYQQVLELAPDHPEAVEGLRRLGHRYLDLAASSLEQGRRDQAHAFLDQAERFVPGEPALAELRERASAPPPPARPDPRVAERCLQACEAEFEGCREQAHAGGRVEDCRAQRREQCEVEYSECINDPQRLSVWGEISTKSACAGVHSRCTRRAEAECGQAGEVAMQRCEADAERCRRDCPGQ